MAGIKKTNQTQKTKATKKQALAKADKKKQIQDKTKPQATEIKDSHAQLNATKSQDKDIQTKGNPEENKVINDPFALENDEGFSLDDQPVNSANKEAADEEFSLDNDESFAIDADQEDESFSLDEPATVGTKEPVQTNRRKQIESTITLKSLSKKDIFKLDKQYGELKEIHDDNLKDIREFYEANLTLQNDLENLYPQLKGKLNSKSTQEIIEYIVTKKDPEKIKARDLESIAKKHSKAKPTGVKEQLAFDKEKAEFKALLAKIKSEGLTDANRKELAEKYASMSKLLSEVAKIKNPDGTEKTSKAKLQIFFNEMEESREALRAIFPEFKEHLEDPTVVNNLMAAIANGDFKAEDYKKLKEFFLENPGAGMDDLPTERMKNTLKLLTLTFSISIQDLVNQGKIKDGNIIDILTKARGGHDASNLFTPEILKEIKNRKFSEIDFTPIVEREGFNFLVPAAKKSLDPMAEMEKDVRETLEKQEQAPAATQKQAISSKAQTMGKRIADKIINEGYTNIKSAAANIFSNSELRMLSHFSWAQEILEERQELYGTGYDILGNGKLEEKLNQIINEKSNPQDPWMAS